MVGSLKSRQHKITPPTLAFSDEAHHGVAATWKEAIEKWSDTTFIGLSATPGARTDGKGLDEIYDGIVCGPSVAELIALGALSDYRWFQGRPPAELAALKLSGSDSADKQAEIMDKPVIIGDMVGNYRQKALGKKAVYFAPNIKMSEDLAAAFTAAGMPFQHIDKSTPDWQRKAVARAIAKGELLGFTNVAIAGEGFDLAAQAGMDVTIEVTGLCRKTQSLPLLIQMAMRCMRAKAEPGLIFDHCDNYSLHQWLPDDDIEWTLQGAIRKPKEAKPVQCPHCLATGYPDGGCCRNCGGNVSETVAAAAARAQMEVIEGELAEVARAEHEAAKAAAAMDRKRAIASLNRAEEIIAYGKSRGYKDGWAKKLIEVKRERGRLVA
jgi:superfamily II DNA or RNA helicase